MRSQGKGEKEYKDRRYDILFGGVAATLLLTHQNSYRAKEGEEEDTEDMKEQASTGEQVENVDHMPTGEEEETEENHDLNTKESFFVKKILLGLIESNAALHSRAEDLIALEKVVRQEAQERYKEELLLLEEEYNEKGFAAAAKADREVTKSKILAQRLVDEQFEKFQGELIALRKELRDDLDQYTQKESAKHLLVLREKLDMMYTTLNQRNQEMRDAMYQEYSEKSQRQLAMASAARTNLGNLEKKCENIADDTKIMNLQRICKLLFDMEFKVAHGQVFYKELEQLSALVSHDPILSSALQNITPVMARKGLYNSSDLYQQFLGLKKALREQAFAPAGSGIFKIAVAKIINAISVPYNGDISGSDPDAIIARTELKLCENDLEGALEELQPFKILHSKILMAWIESVKERLQVEQSLALINSHLRNVIQSGAI